MVSIKPHVPPSDTRFTGGGWMYSKKGECMSESNAVGEVEKWEVQVLNRDQFFIRRLVGERVTESYHPVNASKAVVWMAAAIQGIQPPRDMRPLDGREGDDVAESISAAAESPEVPQQPKKPELEPEEIRERLEVAIRYADSRGVTLKKAAEAVNEALTMLRQGGSDYSL